MREEERLLGVKSFNLRHIIFRQIKVEDIKVLFHTLFAHRLRNADNITLQEIAQSYLGCTFVILFTNGIERRIGKGSDNLIISEF